MPFKPQKRCHSPGVGIPTMLPFNKCCHAVQTPTFCSLLNACESCFIQQYTIYHGCSRVLLPTPGPKSNVEDLDRVAGVYPRMPFSYVVCGLPPPPPSCSSKRHGSAQMPAWEHTPVRMPGYAPDPLEALIARMDIEETRKEERTTSSWRASKQSAVSVPREVVSRRRTKRPYAPAPHREQPHAQVNKRTFIPRGCGCSTASSTEPTSCQSSSRPSHSPSQHPESGLASTSRNKKAFKRPGERSGANFSTYRKRVSFASAAEVQYFEKSRPQRTIKQSSTGRGKGFSLVVLST